MNIFSRIFFPVIAIMILCSIAASAEMVSCAQCGMGADLSARYTSRIAQPKQTLHFCDIGDLFAYLKAAPAAAAEAQVRDYSSGEWIKAQQASYVRSAKKFQTPMGWGIAAFKNKPDSAEFGNALDFNGMMNSLK